ncbi:MAG: HDOD domain-containing protein, partial [Micromonosporaceae bacterium]|nr:HDOD domain-containing protein [Micromonosporaceae bacterium]
LRATIATWTVRSGEEASQAIGALSVLVRQSATTLGVAHPATLALESTLAELRGHSGNPVGAQTALTSLTHRCETLFGSNDLRTLEARNSLAWWLAAAGSVDPAISQFRALVLDCRQSVGVRHPLTLSVSKNLAHWLGEQERPAEAVAELERVLGSARVTFGDRHPEVLRIRCLLADSRGQQDPVRAYRELHTLLEEQERLLGAKHLDVLATRARRDRWERSCMVRVARQPVYDLDGQIVGYELLFRDSNGAVSAIRRDARATSQVMVNAFTDLSLGDLLGGQLCFLNVTREFLVGDLPVPVAPDHLVLEVLGSVDLADQEVADGIRRLADQGYAIALDGAAWGPSCPAVLPLVSYIKLDVTTTDRETARTIAAASTACADVTLIGHMIANDQDRFAAIELGCTLFQGYALGHPQLVTGQTVPTARMRRMELLAELMRPDEEVGVKEAARIIASDPGLSSRVLKMCNTAEAGLSHRVASILGAVVLLGPQRLREWVLLMDLSELVEGDEGRLVTMIDWIKLHQIIGKSIELAEETAFLAGLFSELAVMLRCPLRDIVRQYPLVEELAEAIIKRKGRLGTLLDIISGYRSETVAAPPALSPLFADLVTSYLEAMRYSTTMTTIMASTA